MNKHEIIEAMIEALELIMDHVDIYRYGDGTHDTDRIAIDFHNGRLPPTIYIDDICAVAGDHAIEDIARETAAFADDIKDRMPTVHDIEHGAVRDRIYCEEVNAGRYEDAAKHAPHEHLEDLMVVARYRLDDKRSILVTDDMCWHFRMTPEEVMETAHKNTDSQEHKITRLGDEMRRLMLSSGIPEEYIDDVLRCALPIWVLSNADSSDGAAKITSKDAMKTAYETVGESFYILPSSRHEVLIVPESFISDPATLSEMVRSVNSTVVAPADWLSDNVYQYDGHKIRLAEAEAPDKTDVMTETVTRGHEHTLRR